MSKMTDAIVYSINGILSNAAPNMPENTTEVEQAVKYIQHLLKIHEKDFVALETSLIRFFRIRPNKLNEIKSPISTLYKLLVLVEILPETAATQTPEEKLLSEFIHFLFTPPDPKAKKGDYQALPAVNLSGPDADMVYDIICNVKPGIKDLRPSHGTFDWNPVSHILTNNTRLHDAVNVKDATLFKLLLTAGADVHTLNRLKKSPLDFALSSSDDDIILVLIRHPGISLSEKHIKVLFGTFINAISVDNNEVAKAILSIATLDKKAFVNQLQRDGSTVLHWAAHRVNLSITELLLDNLADANVANHVKVTALMCATGNYNNEWKADRQKIVQLLLNKMTPDAVNQWTPNRRSALVLAIDNKYTDIALLLIQHEGISFHSDILINATDNNQVMIINAVLATPQGQALINEKNYPGKTALYVAAVNGNVETTQILLNHGANANEYKKDHSTALTAIAALEGKDRKPEHLVIARMLLGKMTSSYVNQTTMNGDTALRSAVRHNNPGLILELIKFPGSILDDLFGGRSLEQHAELQKWTDVTNALAKIRAEKQAKEGREAALEKQVAKLTEENMALRQEIAILRSEPMATTSAVIMSKVLPAESSSAQSIKHSNNNL